jgi:capsular exopolysaccharide synthesis family protein
MTIETNSVLDEIRRLCEERQTGVLLLSNAQGERVTISFCEGLLESASSNRGTHRVGDYLVKDGYVTAKDLDALKAEVKSQKMIFGEAIVRKKLVAHGEVGAAVRRQALDLVSHVAAKGFKVASFTNSLHSFYVPARVSFSHILLSLSRENDELFEPMDGVGIVSRLGADPSEFPWNPQELSVLTELQHPRTFSRLLEVTGLKEVQLKKILGVFERLGVIETAPATSISENNGLVSTAGLSMELLIPAVTNAVLDEKLEVARNEFSFASEQFRNLKIQLRQAESETPLKVFTVSSPDAQDGKSLISTNLAFSFAQDPGSRVLIIDCDLRKPTLDRYLGVTSSPGLLQYLSGPPVRPECFLRRVNNLHFLTAGGTAPNPIEALSMRRMKELIDQLRNSFDAIILDAPPYSPIADARVVTAMSDGLLMVIRSGKTAYSSTDRAFRAIDPKKLLGVVLNDVKPMPFQTYHNYGYYQYGDNRMVYAGSHKKKIDPKNYLDS